jgi:hypothetical protein
MSEWAIAAATSDFCNVRRLCDSAMSHARHVNSDMKTGCELQHVPVITRSDKMEVGRLADLPSQALENMIGTSAEIICT